MNSSPITSPAREYLTREQVAELLQAGLRTVDSWIKEGRIPVTKIGRQVRIPSERLAANLAAGTLSQQKDLQLDPEARASALLKLLQPFVKTLVERELERKQVAA